MCERKFYLIYPVLVIEEANDLDIWFEKNPLLELGFGVREVQEDSIQPKKKESSIYVKDSRIEDNIFENVSCYALGR